jgi:hypothetical protein
MKKNIGRTDKITRLVIAALIAVLYLTKVISGTLGIVLLIASVSMLVTSLFNFCPAYTLFGVSTCETKK